MDLIPGAAGPFRASTTDFGTIAATAVGVSHPVLAGVALPEDPAGFEPFYEHPFYPGQVFRLVGPTPADAIREIETLVDVGVQHLPLGFDDASHLRRFVEDVLPHLRLTKRG